MLGWVGGRGACVWGGGRVVPAGAARAGPSVIRSLGGGGGNPPLDGFTPTSNSTLDHSPHAQLAGRPRADKNLAEHGVEGVAGALKGNGTCQQ